MPSAKPAGAAASSTQFQQWQWQAVLPVPYQPGPSSTRASTSTSTVPARPIQHQGKHQHQHHHQVSGQFRAVSGRRSNWYCDTARRSEQCKRERGSQQKASYTQPWGMIHHSLPCRLDRLLLYPAARVSLCRTDIGLRYFDTGCLILAV
jgi:hypothetical protein